MGDKQRSTNRSAADQQCRAAGTEENAQGLYDIEWGEGGQSLVGRRTALAAGGLLVLAAVFAYDYAVLPAEPLVLGQDVDRVDWLWLACLWVDGVYLGGLALADPARTRAFLARLRERPAAFTAGVVVAGLVVLGTLGPPVLGQPETRFAYGHQPPLFTSIPLDNVVNCYNPVGDRCYGSWKHPLGTNDGGKDILLMVVLATRVEAQLIVITTTVIVPVATVVGAVSAYLGGWVDRTVATVAETVKTVPAVLVFLTWRWLFADGSLFALVVAFGLVSWGNVAIIVRNRALNEVGKHYVMAAESAGADTLEVVRDHLIPNVARTAVSIAVYQLPLFVTIEATLSFLKFGSPPSSLLTTSPLVESWGKMIGNNIHGSSGTFWWPVVVPLVALLGTILALNLLADGLEAVLDPRGGG